MINLYKLRMLKNNWTPPPIKVRQDTKEKLNTYPPLLKKPSWQRRHGGFFFSYIGGD